VTSTTCCDGHYENSQLLNAITGNRFDYYGLTNREVLNATDPRLESYSMNYIYDSFEWSHCKDFKSGKYDIKDLLQEIYISNK
jgi:hypothetical protein